MRIRTLTGFSAAVLITAALVACGDDTPRPPVIPTAPTPPGPAPLTITRLELTGPTTVHVGETAQFTVTAHQSDGSTRDVTSDASWQLNHAILLTSAPGRFTGGQKGETHLNAMVGGRSTGFRIIVVPPGTYRLTGTIRDEGIPLRPDSFFIEDEALGRSSPSVINGVYTIYGVAGRTRITVIKNGYETFNRDETITGHQTVDVNMALSRPRSDVSGRYMLTFTAAPECSALPEEARARTYPADVAQTGPRLEVTLEGERFFSSKGRTHNRFGGIVEAQTVRFQLTNTSFDYYQYFYALPDVFEQLSASTLYAVEGVSDASISPNTISGTLKGAIGVFSPSPYRSLARCTSANHQLSLTR
ncbi:MAG: hypothetical protein H0W08_27220 [Acidobacteria bacterium]|nr:hypothetical protein [Acidobacteriota bacterium]